MTLADGEIGSTYTVVGFSLPDKTQRRLETLGMTPGIKVEILNAKSGGTTIIRFRSMKFALGRGIASGIDCRCDGGDKLCQM